MSFFLILSLFIAAFSIIFAVQNTAVVVVQFLFWDFQSALALILLLTLMAGVLIGILISLPSVLRLQKKSKNSHEKTLPEL